MKKIFFILSMIIISFLSLPILKLIFNIPISTYLETIKDKEVISSIILTMKVSFFAVLFILLTGLPLAYLIARYEFKGKSLIESIIDIPTMIPHTAAGIALLFTFGKIFPIIDTTFGIMLAMMFLSAPYLINSAKEGFRKVDIKLENSARILGANPFWTFLKITIPNARKDIVNGMLLMWARGLGEFGAVVIIAYHPMVAPVLIYDRYTSFGLKYSAPVAAVMIIVSIFIFLIIRKINNSIK
ncbi:ABC transporter permease [Caminibacter mediatlanticus]|uniref:Sulfate/molybdate ABC transporter, permease protein n=1 Tax=Caminibacter mediatlanticus TB-2 TaxID=391592 RepID=A0AAI9AJ96_9BACT|nr:ABC transporter permease [Caminibacter mediatlanticus]EDM24555.1 sulfate/molybdate ABC transporter, permease protein [Caminibacter mediatlanticus TB-2]